VYATHGDITATCQPHLFASCFLFHLVHKLVHMQHTCTQHARTCVHTHIHTQTQAHTNTHPNTSTHTNTHTHRDRAVVTEAGLASLGAQLSPPGSNHHNPKPSLVCAAPSYKLWSLSLPRSNHQDASQARHVLLPHEHFGQSAAAA
jgi:hypothetical protein